MLLYSMFTCDQWKSTDSHRYIGTVSSIEKVQQTVKELLKNKVVEYDYDEEEGYEEDIDNMSIHDLQVNVDYFNVVSVTLDETETEGGYFV